MMKKVLSVVLVFAMTMTMFVFSVSAETTITIDLKNDSYSPYTLEGTEMIVTPGVDLDDGQKIEYYLNGEKTGESYTAEDFAFNSVYGTNEMQAKLVSGDTVVATSNIVTKTFYSLVKASTANLRKDSLASWTATNWYARTQPTWVTFVDDPAGGGNKVTMVKAPDDTNKPSVYMFQITEKAYDDFYESEDTGEGIIKISYSIYAENYAGSLDMARLQFKSNGGTVSKHHAYVVASSSDGVLVNKSGENLTRSHTQPVNEWVDVNIVIDNETKKYDVTIDGVQVVTGRSFADYLYTFQLPIHYDGDECATYYLKDLMIAQYRKPYTVTAYTVTDNGESDGLDAFPLSGASVKLEFSENMAEIKKDYISFEVNGNAINFDFSFDESTDTAIITPAYTFIGREKCRLSLNENVMIEGAASSQGTYLMEFDVDLPPYAISKCVTGGIVSGEDAEFEVTVRNSTSDDKDAIVLIGLYKDGGLESVIASEALCPAGEDTDCSAELYIPEDYDTFGYKIVAYLMYKDSFFIIDSFDYQV